MTDHSKEAQEALSQIDLDAIIRQAMIVPRHKYKTTHKGLLGAPCARCFHVSASPNHDQPYEE